MLISDREQIMGTMRRIDRTYEEPAGTFGESETERYVKQCLLVTPETADRAIRFGVAHGWRFRLLPEFHIDLWEPAQWKPVTWRIQNAALWRAIQSRGISLKGEKHGPS